MKELFADIDIEITKENQDEVDKVIHDMLSVDYPNCAAAWKMIRKKLEMDGPGFKERLKIVLTNALSVT